MQPRRVSCFAPEVREWRGSADAAEKGVLFCSGSLGVGKTYLR